MCDVSQYNAGFSCIIMREKEHDMFRVPAMKITEDNKRAIIATEAAC